MVTPEEGDSVSVFDLEEEDVEEGLNAIEAAVDVVTHEEVVGVLAKMRGTGSLPQI